MSVSCIRRTNKRDIKKTGENHRRENQVRLTKSRVERDPPSRLTFFRQEDLSQTPPFDHIHVCLETSLFSRFVYLSRGKHLPFRQKRKKIGDDHLEEQQEKSPKLLFFDKLLVFAFTFSDTSLLLVFVFPKLT